MGNFAKFELTYLKAPCRNCDKRHMNCHSTCEGYIEFTRANEVIRQKKLQKVNIQDTLNRNKINRFGKLRSNSAKFRHGNRRGV